jgi:hypothetical protein
MGKGVITDAAKKVNFMIPKVVKTDNADVDKDKQTKRNLLSSMVAGCLEHDEHILPLYDLYMARIRNDVKKVNDHEFRELTYIYSTKYESFLASWITTVSKFKAADLILLKAKSPQNLVLLAKLGLQLFEGLKLTEDMRNQTFVQWFFTKRHEAIGSPLAALDPAIVLAGAHANGVINLLDIGRYKAEYNDADSLNKLTHSGSGAQEVIDPNDILVRRSMPIQDAHSDFDACFVRDPRPPEFLHTLFPPGTGPHSIPYFAKGKAKQWREHVTSKHKEYLATLTVIDASTAKEIQTALKAQVTTKKKEVMNDVREKNKQRLKTNIGQRRFSQAPGTVAAPATPVAGTV